MKTNLRKTYFFGVSIFICFALMPAPNYAQRENGRPAAKRTYNDTLEKLFADLEKATTADQLRSARSQAREGFKRAVTQDPSYSLPYYNLGVLAEAEGDRFAAIEYFEKFAKLSDRADLSLKAKLKLDYLRLSDASTSQAVRQKFDYDEALRKVNALINLGLLKEAISVAANAAEIDPTRWESYALIGAALLDRKQFRDAVGFLRQASLRAPADVRTRLSAAIKVCEADGKR
jgi:tetratricopeptide (TPR) repeat protein